MQPILLLVGLGNPGDNYAHTRHNAGFWYVQRLAQRYNIMLKNESKYKAITGRGVIGGVDVRLLLPQTFMNRSGQAVVPFCQFYQISAQQMLVAHDELDLPVGNIKIKTGGGHGGHNGLRDIVPHIGADFHRLRIGIGRPSDKSQVSNHVLNRAPIAEQQWMDNAIDEAVAVSDVLIQGDIAKAMNRLNAYKP